MAGRRRRARPGAARRVGRAGREGRFRLRHHLALLQAHPRRAALPRAVRFRPRARVAPRARDGSGGWPPISCGRCRSWCRSIADSSRGVIKVRIGLAALRLAHARAHRERYRVLTRGGRAQPGARPSRPRICAAPATTSTTCCSIRNGCAWRTCCRPCRHGARAFNYAQVEEVRRDAAGKPNGVRVRDLLTGSVATLRARVIVNATGPWVDELRALARVSDRGLAHPAPHQGHSLRAAAPDRPRDLSIDARRPDDLRDPVARVLAGGHDRHRLRGRRRRSRSAPRHPRRGRLPARRGAAGRCRIRASRRARSSTPTPGCGRSRSKKASASRTCRGRTRSSRRHGASLLSITGTKLTCFRSLAEELGDRVTRALGAARAGSHRAADARRRRRGSAPRRGAHLDGRLRRRGVERPRAGYARVAGRRSTAATTGG